MDSMLAYLENVLERKGHAVICVAEGAAQDLIRGQSAAVSGENLGTIVGASGGGGFSSDDGQDHELADVGAWLRSAIKHSLADVDVKYIDPSYLIRSVPSASNDRIYCRGLANGAVHAAFAGYTGSTVGLVNTHFVYLPIPIVIQAPRNVDPQGELWNRLRSSIGQPNLMDPPPPTRQSSVSPASTPGRTPGR
jgi:6-phosphofructokinase 1